MKRKSKKNNFYELVFSRECIVPTMEVWYIAENDFLYKVLGKKFPKNGYMFFEYKNGIAKNFLDMEAVKKIYADLVKEISINPSHFFNIEKIFWEYFKKIRKYLIGKAAIVNIDELRDFFKNTSYAWGAMVPSYWLTYFGNPLISKNIFKKSEKIRLAIENIIPDLDKIFTASLKKIYKNNFHPNLLYATFNEIIKNKIPSQKILKQRGEHSIYFKKEIFFINLINFLKKTKKNVRKTGSLKNITELKGVTAFRGMAKGIVRLILSSKQVGKFKDNEILVAPNTSPEYMPAIIKSRAIVTDEGGMLSHAAIISRELKKPCIIGTKIATKVLHDGDFIEVDANKGVVKIIKRNENH